MPRTPTSQKVGIRNQATHSVNPVCLSLCAIFVICNFNKLIVRVGHWPINVVDTRLKISVISDAYL